MIIFFEGGQGNGVLAAFEGGQGNGALATFEGGHQKWRNTRRRPCWPPSKVAKRMFDGRLRLTLGWLVGF